MIIAEIPRKGIRKALITSRQTWGDPLIAWNKLAEIRTVVMVLAGLILIAVGAFVSPWPWIGWPTSGAALLLLAYLTDASAPSR